MLGVFFPQEKWNNISTVILNELLIHVNNIDISQNNYAEQKKPDKKENLLYNYIWAKFQKMKTCL